MSSARTRALKRDLRIITVSGALALAGIASGVWHGATATPPRPEVISAQVQGQADGSVRLAFAGDTMLGDAMTEVIAERGVDDVLAGIAPVLGAADFAMVNAEAPLTTRAIAQTGGRFQYTVDPSTATALKNAGVDAFGMGNNHTMDAGPEGMADTQHHAAAAGVITVGAGSNAAEAERPLILHMPGRTVGVVVLNEYYGQRSAARDDTPGSVSFSPESIQRGVDLARAAGAEEVIAFVHWGDNYSPVNEKQRYWGDLLVRAGYDVVIGSGSHAAQPIEVIDGVPVVWDLGNFVFGSPGRFDRFDVPGRGIVAQVTWGPDGSRQLEATCLVTDNKIVDFQTRVCTPEENVAFVQSLGPGVTQTATGGKLTF